MFSDMSLLNVSIALRNFARKLGLIKGYTYIIQAYVNVFGEQNYEEQFDKAMFQEIRLGDIVWDVGANLGLYTEKFMSAVGSSGKVFAFEPAPQCFSKLQNRSANMSNVTLFNCGMGKVEETLALNIAEDPLDAVHSFVSASPVAKANSTVNVSIKTGDGMVEKENLPCPTVIKIDVEGFEEEVLLGLKKNFNAA